MKSELAADEEAMDMDAAPNYNEQGSSDEDSRKQPYILSSCIADRLHDQRMKTLLPAKIRTWLRNMNRNIRLEVMQLVVMMIKYICIYQRPCSS